MLVSGQRSQGDRTEEVQRWPMYTCVKFGRPTEQFRQMKDTKELNDRGTWDAKTTTHALASSAFSAFFANSLMASSRGSAFNFLNTPPHTSAIARWISPRHFGSTDDTIFQVSSSKFGFTAGMSRYRKNEESVSRGLVRASADIVRGSRASSCCRSGG